MRTSKMRMTNKEFSKRVKSFRDFKMSILTRTTKFSLDDEDEIEKDCYDFPPSTGIRVSCSRNDIANRLCYS